MFGLISVPIILAGGYYYFTFNKKKVVEKALDMYASIVVYSKDKLNFKVDDMFSSNYINLIYQNNENQYNKIDIASYFVDYLKEISNNQNINFQEIEEKFDISNNKENRILFSYNYDNKDYFHYLCNKSLMKILFNDELIEVNNTFPIINKEKFELFKNNKLNPYFYKEEHINDSFYILLNGDLKHIETVKLFNKETGEYEVDMDGKLKELFNKLKGPFNDWGLLTLNLIKNKWIFDDFDIDKKYKIIIKQGLYLNEETFDLESDIIEIEYNNEFIKLPSLYKLFLNKIKKNGLEFLSNI